MYKLTEENKVKEGLKKQVYQSTKNTRKTKKIFQTEI
jgi:hypothetical protein